KGASAYLMCEAALAHGKTVHLFDSFEGLSNPRSIDGSYWRAGGLRAPESQVSENLARFANYRVYKGWIPTRFDEVSHRGFCFIHVDVDLYEPTRDSIRFFFDRIVDGGILLMDDYGFATCPGAKLAADEFFSTLNVPIVMLTTGQAIVIKR